MTLVFRTFYPLSLFYRIIRVVQQISGRTLRNKEEEEWLDHFKLACVGNLAFKGDQSINVIWQWSYVTHLDINRHDDLVIGWVQNKERENNTTTFFIDLFNEN